MDHAGDHIFTGSTVSQNDDAALCRRDRLDGVDDTLHDRAVCHQHPFILKPMKITLTTKTSILSAVVVDDALPLFIMLGTHVIGHHKFHVSVLIQYRYAVGIGDQTCFSAKRTHDRLLLTDGFQYGRPCVHAIFHQFTDILPLQLITGNTETTCCNLVRKNNIAIPVCYEDGLLIIVMQRFQ